MGDSKRRRAQPRHQRGRGPLTRAVVDSSVLLGFLDGDPACANAYARYEWVTTHAHLLEVYAVLRSRPEAADPDGTLRDLLPLAIPIPDAAVRPAAELRRRLRSQRKECSYIDALGYGVAAAHKTVLLIAEEAFRGVQGVETIPLHPPPGRRSQK